MRLVIDQVDFLLDLHSMHERSAPLSVCGPLEKGIARARALGTPAWVISDEGHREGRRMRDYAGFGDPASPKNALLIECGQHWEAGATDVGREVTGGFLVLHGVLDAADLPHGWLRRPETAQKVVRVIEPMVASSLDFRFAGNYTGLETAHRTHTGGLQAGVPRPLWASRIGLPSPGNPSTSSPSGPNAGSGAPRWHLCAPYRICTARNN